MIHEMLLHVRDTISDQQKADLLAAVGNREGYISPRHTSRSPHLVFVAYDTDELCPHDVVEMANESGFHTQMVEM